MRAARRSHTSGPGWRVDITGTGRTRLAAWLRLRWELWTNPAPTDNEREQVQAAIRSGHDGPFRMF